LGGAQDRATLAGSNYVYEGSSCGKIIQSLKQTQCMNPIFYFDELDKTSGTEKGNEIINLLIHLTDYTQNSHFMDDYMDGIAIDLSRATFIFSFNDKSKVSPILLDRMEIIKFNSYSNAEKMIIARDFLLPNVIKNVFNNNDINNNNINIVISDANMAKIISSYEGMKPMQPMQPMQPMHPMHNGKRISKRKLEKKLFCNKKIDNHIHKFGKIMKKVAKRNNRIGGVRYIKKILERIVSRINLEQLLQKNNNLDKHKKKNSKITICDKIVNDIVNDILSNK
jgi:ATP-dependent Lon protease